MSLPERLQLGRWRTAELRQLLEDEDKIKLLVSCSDKFQKLQRAAEKILISNQKLAKVSLSQKPRLRDTKLLLAVKHRELEQLRNIVQLKQEQLEKNNLRYAKRSLLRKVNQQEEKSELLFQRLSGGKVSLEDFLDSLLRSRILQHVRLVLVTKLQELMGEERGGAPGPGGGPPQGLSVGFPEQISSLCSLSSAVLVPACCQPHFLLPLSASQCVQHPPLYCDESLQVVVRRRGLRWPVRPVRLQPLKRNQPPPPPQ